VTSELERDAVLMTEMAGGGLGLCLHEYVIYACMFDILIQ
jgi:hypothetical protein